MEVEWREEYPSQASISLFASSSNLVPHPSSPISFRYSFALRAATLERALHPPLVKLLIPTTFCIPLFRFSFRCDTSIYLCISSCFVTSVSALLFLSRFFFFSFFFTTSYQPVSVPNTVDNFKASMI